MKQFEERVQVVRDCLRDKLEEVHKVNSDKQEGKRLRTFEVGDNVLLRKEGLSDKLSQAWKGPFKITKSAQLTTNWILVQLVNGNVGRLSTSTTSRKLTCKSFPYIV